MAFEITIDQFEGPLDLMLHLIKENKLDLFDLNMDTLTDQYLAYLNTMEAMHLEVASEYLAELAGLIEYKSKKLLPREKVVIEEEYEEDQRDKLVKRLLEYQRFKEVSQVFQKQYEERQKHMSKPMSQETGQWMKVIVDENVQGSPYDLVKAMNKVLRRLALSQPYETKVTVKEMSVDERKAQIIQRLRHWSGKMSFETLCNDCTSLHMVIVSFLAMLDMIRLKLITYMVDEEEMIWIVKGEGAYA